MSSSKTSDNVVTREYSGGVLKVTVSRPESLNALNSQVLQELQLIFSESLPADIRAVLLCGAGDRAFVAGADIAEMQGASPAELRTYIELGHRVMASVAASPVPVLAAVRGFALGGGFELALACDFIVANDAAKVGLPEINLGIMPGFGGTARLLDRVSVADAKKLVMSGKPVSGRDALSLGLVDYCFADDEFEAGLEGVLGLVTAQAPLALREMKSLFTELQLAEEQRRLTREVEGFCRLFATEDAREGVTAFVEKRKASFQGR